MGSYGILAHFDPGLANALHGILQDGDCDLMVRLGPIDLLVILAAVPRVRPVVTEILERFRKTDLDLGATQALERINEAAAGAAAARSGTVKPFHRSVEKAVRNRNIRPTKHC
ncbi:MAG TPA: hypothetical protein VMH81_35015 [Bryobacteraceae bacterium]|nr:hypothetical protein [Bryobacteraceae bacterium]